MKTSPVAAGLELLGALVATMAGRKVSPPVLTDVDFRPLPERRDVIAGWEGRPSVPGATRDEVR